ncbi:MULTISPECIES: TrmH family RNA methyltransferase [Streptomyces]|uniref:TrmH family RNA methyltransferase n=1 Tax=Streptomyces TaxID=1883 RepID=UPI0023B8E539|nr:MULTISPECIES: RNA methyltransferase [unclassified Streptomyces]MDT0420619.1 RNA methyltransferase [Streptomyces sp. DSM 41859]WEH26453.1 RNA methyltransferase [Streptomyces sp. AM 3-1-1]
MAVPERVDDPADPRLGDYTSLTDVQLRRRREPEEGLFIAEGEKVVRRALDSGHGMRSMLLTEKWLPAMADVIEASEAPVYLVSPETAERVTGYHVHRGALASLHRTPLPAPADVLAGARRVAVFEDLVDHANLGAAFRNAAALGVDAALLTPRCADPLYRRAVKVSMGAVFSLPYARLEHWPADADTIKQAGFTLAAFCLSDRSLTLDALVAREDPRLALLFGSEGPGLTPAALTAADLHVRIPMQAGIDSLNVAAATAVVFYATRRNGPCGV